MTHPQKHPHDTTHTRQSHRPDLFTLLGPMPFLLTLAAVVTASAAVYSTHAFDTAALDSTRLEEIDRKTRDDLVARGWEPQPTELVASVELLVAKRPFRLDLGHGALTAGPPEPTKLAKARETLAHELSRYPAGFLRKVRLRRVLLCQDLEENERPIPSLPNHASTLLVDVDAGQAFLSRLVHHEVFHFLDFADDQLVVRDPAWEQLNDPDFRYEGGGRAVRDPAATGPSSGPPGFVTRYATAALEEDKAEIFSWLMTDKALLAARTMNDSILRKKVSRIHGIVSAFFPLTLGPAPYGSWP